MRVDKEDKEGICVNNSGNFENLEGKKILKLESISRNREIQYFVPLRRNLVAFYLEFLNYFTFTVGSTEL